MCEGILAHSQLMKGNPKCLCVSADWYAERYIMPYRMPVIHFVTVRGCARCVLVVWSLMT